MLKITMVGTGYVGLVTGCGFADIGHKVICCDIDKQKIKNLQNNEIPIFEPGLAEIFKKNVKQRRLEFSSDVADSVRKSDIIFIAVGTPEQNNGEADISAVKTVSGVIRDNLKKYKLICVKSTVPLETYDIIRSIISKKKNNAKFDIVANPEFLREGSSVKDFFWPDRIIIGCDSNKAFNILEKAYKPLYRRELPIVRCSIPTAVIIKYASNSFLAVKVGFINEIAALCDVTGGSVSDVSKALGMDGRISPKFLHPGPGFGGSCFPKDTKALVKMSYRKKMPAKIVEAAIQSNSFQKKRMTEKLKKMMKGKIEGKKVAVLGLAFKAQTDDVRESSSIDMIRFLRKNNALVMAYDPEASENMKKVFPDIKYFDTWQEAVKGASATVIMTEWNEFRSINIGYLGKLMKSKILLDTRNLFDIKTLLLHKFKFSTTGLGSN